jgi:hypothetical protein
MGASAGEKKVAIKAVTIIDASDRLGVTINRVQALIREGQLERYSPPEVYGPGRRPFVTLASLKKYIEKKDKADAERLREDR